MTPDCALSLSKRPSRMTCTILRVEPAEAYQRLIRSILATRENVFLFFGDCVPGVRNSRSTDYFCCLTCSGAWTNNEDCKLRRNSLSSSSETTNAVVGEIMLAQAIF